MSQVRCIMHLIKLAAQVEPVPKIGRTLMLLNRGQMNLDAAGPDQRELGQQAVVQMRVMAEPIIDKGIADDRWGHVRKHRTQTVAQWRAAMDHIIPMPLEE